MITANLRQLNLFEGATEADPSIQIRVDFPFYAARGTTSSAVVYFELDPGKRLGLHRDSAEEIILVLQGQAEAVVGEERGRLGQHDLAVIPAMVPHDITNVGKEMLRVVGFFASATLSHIFYEPLLPGADVAIFVHAQGEQEAFTGAPLSPPVE